VKVRTIWVLIKETFSEWQFKDVSLLAGSLAYYTVFSLAPLLVIAITIVGTFFGEEEVKARVIEQLQNALGSQPAAAIEVAIANTQDPESSQNFFGIPFNIAILLFAASNIFAQIQMALDRIWEVKPEPGRNIFHFMRKRILSFVMMLVIAFLGLGYFVIDNLVAWFMVTNQTILPGFRWIWQGVDLVLFLAIMTLLVTLIYNILPDARVTWRDAVIGALVTAVLFAIGQFLFGIFLQQTDVGSTYGVAGSLVIIISWVYYAAHILLLGAEFTQVYARRHGEQIVPSAFAVCITSNSPERSQPEAAPRSPQQSSSDRPRRTSRGLPARLWQHCIQGFRRITGRSRRR
jgi:membrane protein